MFNRSVNNNANVDKFSSLPKFPLLIFQIISDMALCHLEGVFLSSWECFPVIPTERSEWRDLRDQKTDGSAPLTMTNAPLIIILPSESRLLQSKRKKQIGIPCRIVVLIGALKVFAVRLHPPGQPWSVAAAQSVRKGCDARSNQRTGGY